MKWIFALLFLFSINVFAVESVPAKSVTQPDVTKSGMCSTPSGGGFKICSSAESAFLNYISSRGYVLVSHSVQSQSLIQSNWIRLVYAYYLTTSPTTKRTDNIDFQATPVTIYSCPPDGNPTFTIGPVDLNGSKVCQKPPKVCMMGAIVRVASDGSETCVSNCSAASGLIKTSQFYYQAGPDVGSTAGQVQCYGQCAVQTSGGYTQLSNGSYTGTFAFTGANCPVIRPEPTVDSESNTGGNGDAPAVDESTTSEGTDNALGELSGAASSATGSQVQPSATGPDGTSTLNDVAQTVADAANAQIQATSSQNVATGNLIANTTKDLQNTIIRTGSAGASSVLQAQGNSKLDGIGSAIGDGNGKLDGIGSAIGAGNGKLDGIQSTLNDISDKLEEPGEETPFLPGAGSGAFWESILPESSFTEIKDKQAQSIQDMKDLSTEFQDSISFTDLSASGAPDEWSLNVHGTALPFGLGAFQLLIDMGIAAIVLFLCALYTIYIITSRK
ncbi:hypothetical protein ACLH0G_03690 [Aeromonas rivipollensis]|uniref:hypothetical protein n=1 Tax=Aeromonas rivipollensis TaxID=948519 RepID=UPI003D089FA8